MSGAARLLFVTAGAHVVVGCIALALLVVADAPAVMGVHPALKPMKFGFSIAVFLATMGLVVPRLALSSTQQLVVAALLCVTMVVEMVPIGLQAARGTTSHFNTADAGSARWWMVMMVAIVVATLVMAGVALVATAAPLKGTDAPAAWAWRIGLWLFLLTAVSGFAMGGRGQHGVGGVDGGAGVPLLNWSRSAGDLRVSHFVALHAVQALPLLAWLLGRTSLAAPTRLVAVVVAGAALTALAVATLAQAFMGRPFLR